MFYAQQFLFVVFIYLLSQHLVDQTDVCGTSTLPHTVMLPTVEIEIRCDLFGENWYIVFIQRFSCRLSCLRNVWCGFK